jgi:hypothetical protein
MIRRIFCFLGFHKWQYNKDKTKRWCSCGIAQELWANIFWLECIDGEPIE